MRYNAPKNTKSCEITWCEFAPMAKWKCPYGGCEWVVVVSMHLWPLPGTIHLWAYSFQGILFPTIRLVVFHLRCSLTWLIFAIGNWFLDMSSVNIVVCYFKRSVGCPLLTSYLFVIVEEASVYFSLFVVLWRKDAHPVSIYIQR